MREMGDGAGTRYRDACNQPSDPGMREDTDTMVLEPERAQHAYQTRMHGTGLNPQGPCLLTRWTADMVAS